MILHKKKRKVAMHQKHKHVINNGGNEMKTVKLKGFHFEHLFTITETITLCHMSASHCFPIQI